MASFRQVEGGPSGNLSPHKTTSGLFSTAVLYQVHLWDNGANEARQCHIGNMHQQIRWNALPGTVPASTNDLGLVHLEGCLSGVKTLTMEGQNNSRPQVAINERLLPLDAEPLSLPANMIGDALYR